MFNKVCLEYVSYNITVYRSLLLLIEGDSTNSCYDANTYIHSVALTQWTPQLAGSLQFWLQEKEENKHTYKTMDYSNRHLFSTHAHNNCPDFIVCRKSEDLKIQILLQECA